MNIDTLQAYITITKDVVTCLAALTAAVIGIMGLQTWKTQLRGKTEYELAQRLAKAVYKIRNGTNELIAIFRFDLLIAPQFSAIDPQPKSRYENHIRQENESATELDSLLLEAEAIWGRNVSDAFGQFRLDIGTSLIDIADYIDELEKFSASTSDEVASKKRKEILDDFERWETRIKKQQSDNVRKIESFLKPYLKL